MFTMYFRLGFIIFSLLNHSSQASLLLVGGALEEDNEAVLTRFIDLAVSIWLYA